MTKHPGSGDKLARVRPIPPRHSYGTEQLPTPAAALDLPMRTFPSAG